MTGWRERCISALPDVRRAFLYAYVLFIFIQYPISAAFPTTLVFYALLLPVFGWFVFKQWNEVLDIIKDPLTAQFLSLFVFIVLHALLMTDVTEGISKTISNTLVNAIFFIVSIIFFRNADEKFLHHFFNCYVLLAGVCAIVSLVLFYTNQAGGGYRLAPIGRSEHPILGAHVYIIAAMVALYLAARIGKGRLLTLYVAVISVIGLMILLTHSRTAIATYAICLITGLLLYTKPAARRRAIWGMGISLGALLICFLYVEEVQHYLRSLLERGDSYRFYLWKQSFLAIVEYPWLGNGMRARLIPPEGIPNAYSPHNIYIATAYYLGLPAACFFLYILYRTAMAAVNAAMTGNYLGVLLLTLLLNGLLSGMTDHAQLVKSPSALWLIFWLPLAFVIASKMNRSGNLHT